MSERTIQAGKLGHYTWIIDEIQLEEAKSKTQSQDYVQPFEDATNDFGIPNNTIQTADINDLVTLIGNFFGATFVPVKNIPLSGKGQRGRIKSIYMKKILNESNKLYQVLNVHTPGIEQPENF